jgi:hypothetical protein
MVNRKEPTCWAVKPTTGRLLEAICLPRRPLVPGRGRVRVRLTTDGGDSDPEGWA